MSLAELRPGRLLWTAAVTFYCGVFFRNLLADAGGGTAGLSFALTVAAVFVLLVWMAIEYYFGAPFFQSGIVEPDRFQRVLFALFVYPYIGYVVADRFWWRLTQLPLPPAVTGLPGVLVLAVGCYVRLSSLLALLAAVRRESGKGRGRSGVVVSLGTLSRLRFQQLCRQPRYLGTLLQLLGIALAFNSWGGLLLAVALGLPLVWVQAQGEYSRVAAVDPVGHGRYATQVPLLFPRLRR